MTIEVQVDRGRMSVPRSIFVDLLGNSVVNHRVPYQKALESGQIHLSELIDLARKAEVPYTLFFAPQALVDAQIQAKTKKLLQGVSPDTFTVNSRSEVKLGDIELIVKDLLNKQSVLRKHDKTLVRNPIVGLLREPRASAAEEARVLRHALELDMQEIWSASKSETALERIIARLEAKQVLVSRSVRGFMPQLIEVRFSGMTVRDSKVPYIFLSGGDHLDFQEPTGRQIFTLVLMSVLVARGVFAPVTYNAHSTAPQPGREYDIVGEILMPTDKFAGLDLTNLDVVRGVARNLKVTPSAMTVRALRVGTISADVANDHLAELEAEFRQRPKPQARNPNLLNGVRKYSSRELAVRLIGAVDAGSLAPREFCRVVTLNHLKPAQIGEFREALR